MVVGVASHSTSRCVLLERTRPTTTGPLPPTTVPSTATLAGHAWHRFVCASLPNPSLTIRGPTPALSGNANTARIPTRLAELSSTPLRWCRCLWWVRGKEERGRKRKGEERGKGKKRKGGRRGKGKKEERGERGKGKRGDETKGMLVVNVQ